MTPEDFPRTIEILEDLIPTLSPKNLVKLAERLTLATKADQDERVMRMLANHPQAEPETHPNRAHWGVGGLFIRARKLFIQGMPIKDIVTTLEPMSDVERQEIVGMLESR